MQKITELFHYLLYDGGTVQAGSIDNEVAAFAVPFRTARIQFGKKPLRFGLLRNRQES